MVCKGNYKQKAKMEKPEAFYGFGLSNYLNGFRTLCPELLA